MADLNKIRKAFPEFKDTSDAELIGHISKMTGASVGEISDTLQIAPRGTLAESARQFAGGLVSDLPKMFGQAAQYFVPEGSQAAIDAKGLVDRAEARGIGYEPDIRGRGMLGKAAVYGARGVAPAGAVIGSAFIPGAGEVIAPIAAATLFGGSSAQETYEKILEQTGNKEDAAAAARRVGLIQGVGEAAATFVGGKALKGIAPAFGLGEKTTAGVLKGATDTAIAKPFAKSMAINSIVQPGTEVAQDLGTYAVEQAYGAKPEDPYAIAEQSALGGFGMNMWLGPLALGGHKLRARKAQQFSDYYNEAMYGENATPETRRAALQAVATEAKRQGVKVDDTEAWMNRQLREEEAGLNYLKAQEDALIESGKQSSLADISFALTDPELSPKISDTDRQSLIGILDTAREGDLTPEATDAALSQAKGIIGQYMVAEQDASAETNLLKPTGLQTTPALFAPFPKEEINLAGGLTQVQTNLPADTSAYAPDTNVGREMPRVQQPAPVQGTTGISTVAPGVFEVNQPLQQVETKAAAPVVPPVTAPAAPPVTAPAATPATTPAAPVSGAALTPKATKTSTQGLTTNTYDATDSQSTPVTVNVTRGVTGRVTRAEVVKSDKNGKVTERRTLTNFGESALSPTDSAFLQAALPDHTFGKPSVSPLGSEAEAAPLPSAQVAGGVSSTPITTATQNGPQTTQAKQTKTQGQESATTAAVDTGPKNVSEAIKEDNEIDTVLKAIEAENEKTDNLFAGVTGETKKAPGKPSMPTQVYAAIRNAILNPKGAVMVRKAKSVEKDAAATTKYGEKIKRIAQAATDFANAYEAYASQNLVRTGKDRPETIKRGTTAEEQVEGRATILKANANAVRAALAKLGEAVDGNAKDVEAIVRFVKDRAQKERKGDVKAEKADITLSRAWAAAKSEAFIGEPDLLATSSNEVRQSTEATAKGAVPQLVDAVNEGYATFGRGEKEKGLNGLLNYIRTVGTPFEKLLALAIKRAIAGKRELKIEFAEGDAKPQFNPKTNTLTLSRTSSKEVSLHEALHGALQWFVYSNPNLPQVQALKNALNRVLSYDPAKLSPKAAEVQAVLKKTLAGKSKTADLDAVLELISYGSTLNDFRRALQGMESNAPRTFTKFANDVMEAIHALVRRMLGVKQSIASDVLDNTFQLLEAARAAEQTEASKGNILKAEVSSTSKPAKVNAQDYAIYNKQVAPAALSTKFFFDLVGWQRGAEKLGELSTKAADKIRKDFPKVQQYLSYVNSKFGVNVPTVEAMSSYRLDRHTGYQRMEQLANLVQSRSADEILAIVNYLDGNTKALDKLPDAAKVKEIADSVTKYMAMYISELPAKDRAYFENTKFSESLLFAGNTKQVASNTFGARKLSEIIGLQHRFEETIEGFQHWMGKDKNGDVDVTGPFYQVFGPNVKDPAGPQVPQGYMSIKEFNANGNPVGFTVDPSRQWRISGKKGEGYKFTSNMTAQQAVAENKADSLANAMRNTMAALAGNYASRNFSKAASTIGYENGKPTELSVAFSSLSEIKDVFGRAPDPTQILKVSSDESRSAKIANLYRSSNTWVRIPDAEAYGALAGKYMPGPVWSAMTDMSDRKPAIPFDAFNTSMRWFKKSKTVYNPGTHITNIASNVTLAMMHDIPVSTVSSAAKLFAKYELNPKSLAPNELAIMSQFMNSGAMLGDYSSAEVKEAISKAWSENLQQPTDTSLLERLKIFTGYEKSKAQLGVALATKYAGKADAIASELYAAEDNIFRLAAFMKKVGELQERNGETTPSEATFKAGGTFAREAFLDYDIDSKAVRILRQSALPFVSWLYAIMPVMGRIAVNQPWKIANVMMAYYLLDVAMASMAGGDDDELRKSGPEYIRERMFGIGPYMHIRIPFMGDDENPVYYRLGDYIPLASAAKGLPNGFLGQSWIPGAITPSGPMVSAILGFVGGIDPYTGKPLHDPTDTDWQKFKNNVVFAYDTVTPPAVNSRQFKSAMDTLDEKTGITGNPMSNLYIARTFGLKLYDFNVEESEAIQEQAVKRIERDFKTAMRKAKREEERKGYPDYEALDKVLEDLQTRMEKEIDKARAGDGVAE